MSISTASAAAAPNGGDGDNAKLDEVADLSVLVQPLNLGHVSGTEPPLNTDLTHIPDDEDQDDGELEDVKDPEEEEFNLDLDNSNGKEKTTLFSDGFPLNGSFRIQTAKLYLWLLFFCPKINLKEKKRKNLHFPVGFHFAELYKMSEINPSG